MSLGLEPLAKLKAKTCTQRIDFTLQEYSRILAKAVPRSDFPQPETNELYNHITWEMEAANHSVYTRPYCWSLAPWNEDWNYFEDIHGINPWEYFQLVFKRPR